MNDAADLAAPRSHPPPDPEPLLPLPGTGWHVWRSTVLRGAGFPVDGLDRLTAPECAVVADRHLSGVVDGQTFAAAFHEAVTALGKQLRDIASDPLFRQAVTWQSPTSVAALDGLAATGPDAPRNWRCREREIVVARYWQRYCGKNDTIGFFGPVCWSSFAETAPAANVRPGPDRDAAGVVRRRVVDFEWRALTAFADRLGSDPRYRDWLPVTLQPHLHFDASGPVVHRVGAPPVHLTPAQTALLSALVTDSAGGRLAGAVVAAACADPTAGLRRRDDALLLLDQLAAQGLVRWRLDLPYDLRAEEYLRRWMAGIGDPTLRAEAWSRFGRLDTARAAVAAARTPERLRAVLSDLEAQFAAVTAAPARHRAGETYAGRGLVYEDTLRDVEVVLGGPILDALARPLAVLLHAARWLTVAVADAYLDVLRTLYAEAVAELDVPEVPMGELWYLANGVMFGAGPTAGVMAEFARRWADLLDLNGLASGTRRVTRSAAELADAVERVFPAGAPAWTAGRIHSPDLHICAAGPQALARGEFTAVLGELHVAWLTCDVGTFVRFHPDPDALRAAAARDLGQRIVLLYPTDFPQLTARITEGLVHPGDIRLAYTPAPTGVPGQVLPLAGLTVSEVAGQLVATGPDGRRWPLVELFGPFLSALAVNAYKLVAAGPHTPRVTVDRLVVQRETWRCTVADTGLVGVRGEADRYLAARRWRAAFGLPERVFVRVGTELKPCYVDLTSPAFVAAFAALVRAAHRTGGERAEVVVSELLPGPEDAWLTDAAGRRYSSELRITARDPVPAPGARPAGQ